MLLKERASSASSAGPSSGARAPCCRVAETVDLPPERTRQEPGENEPGGDDRDAEQRQPQPAFAHVGGDVGGARRDPHGADDASLVDHRHRDEQELLAQALAETAPRVDLAAEERLSQLRPGSACVRDARAGEPCAVDEDPSGRVGDHHPLGARSDALVDEPRDCTAPRRAGSRRVLGDHVCEAGRQDRRVAQDGGLEVGARAALNGQCEGHRERDHDRCEHVERREQESRAEAHLSSSAADANLNPTPRTVWM
jgi:hypothetical protein